MKKYSIKVFILFFASLAFAREPLTIIFQFEGSDRLAYVKEELSIDPAGQVELSTLSPVPFRMEPNEIGKFSFTTDKKNYQKFFDKLKSLQSAKSFKSDAYVHHAIRAGFFFKDEENRIQWNLHFNESLKSLEAAYFDIKKEALKNPVSTLKLNCVENAKNIDCAISSTDAKGIETIDPLKAFNTIFCHKGLEREALNGNDKIYDPNRMKPDRITVKAKSDFKFQITNAQCKGGHILVKFSDMLVNPLYQKSFLGTLISNKL